MRGGRHQGGPAAWSRGVPPRRQVGQRPHPCPHAQTQADDTPPPPAPTGFPAACLRAGVPMPPTTVGLLMGTLVLLMDTASTPTRLGLPPCTRCRGAGGACLDRHFWPSWLLAWGGRRMWPGQAARLPGGGTSRHGACGGSMLRGMGPLHGGLPAQAMAWLAGSGAHLRRCCGGGRRRRVEGLCEGINLLQLACLLAGAAEGEGSRRVGVSAVGMARGPAREPLCRECSGTAHDHAALPGLKLPRMLGHCHRDQLPRRVEFLGDCWLSICKQLLHVCIKPMAMQPPGVGAVRPWR